MNLSSYILRDRKTGVNYLYSFVGGVGGSITPLLGADGKAVVTSEDENYGMDF